MSKKILADCHLHSNTSFDAADTIDAMCQSAISQGLKHICFCNHFEIFPGRHTVQEYIFDYDVYSDEVERAREKYGAQLEILKGFEFGQPQHHRREYEALAAKEFDMVAVALHFVPIEFGLHWLWCDQKDMQREVCQHITEVYFEEMRHIIEIDGFDVLAHCDWLRSIYPREGAFSEATADIIEQIVKRGKLLEINTSGYRNGLSGPYPDDFVLTHYRRAGGRRITVGSDAHRREDIGSHFDQASTALKRHQLQAGFFRRHQFVPL